MDIQKIKTRLGLNPDKPLSPEERRKRARYFIYPAMGLLFAGSLWLIYSPSGKEKAAEDKAKGFNTEMPSPEKRQMEGNKVNAYEQDELAEKQKQRKDLFDKAGAWFSSDPQQNDDVQVPEPVANPVTDRDSYPTAGTVRSSADAYRNMNSTLDNFYIPANDPEREELRKRIEELEKQDTDRQPEGNSMEEKMALMEKSYELASRYNSKQAPAVLPVKDKKARTAVKPVKNVQQHVVSSLSQPVSDDEFISGLAGERNRNFQTPVGKVLTSERNTIPACVHGTQTVSDGQALRLRLLEPMVVDGHFIPEGTVLTGGTRIEGERLDIVINAVEFKGSVLPVELEVYDADGQQGILVPNSMEYDAVREIAANMGTSMGSSINISTDAGAQIASDLGKGVIQGVSQYVSKKMRTVKITLKAGHKLLLHSPEE
ncbi:conjugative transposon protein TraM [Bacteroides reticulotermitis]|uniref:Conjugative transposon protein TraM n=2 Tax=Bacteroides reticulotermitis TaxID=1133319 RepID=W4UUH4_9BACE|nr:conjugative transposon protein TraM [Bacteroides reticulotermitis]GAE84895.1 conjugative transposon protein TraM [Bacteroides reticulotermitis JCM 10512]